MARLVMLSVPAHGHVDPTFGLMRALVARGHRVWQFAAPAQRAGIERSGASFAEYPVPFWSADGAPVEGLKVMENLVRAAEHVTAPLLPRLEALEPQAILHDAWAPWGLLAARALRRPAVSVHPNPAYDLRAYLKTATADRAAVRRLLRGLPAAGRMVLRSVRLHRRLGLPWTDPWAVAFNAEPLNLVLSPEALQIDAARMAPRYQFVGAAFELEPPAAGPEGPLVYVSLGTIYNRAEAWFVGCVEAFRGAPYAVLISAGSAAEAVQARVSAPNVTVQAFLPQVALLQRASAFVTHCGGSGVSQALTLGVPMVGIPRAADQYWLARRVEALGVGVRLGGPELPRPAEVRAAVERILEDAPLRARSAALARASGGPTGGERGAALVEAYLAATGAAPA